MECPGKRNAALEAHKQWRIAQRCEAATHIGYQEDKEHDDMYFILTPFIGTDNRAYHNHCRTGGSNPAGQECPDKKEQGVHLGGPCQ